MAVTPIVACTPLLTLFGPQGIPARLIGEPRISYFTGRIIDGPTKRPLVNMIIHDRLKLTCLQLDLLRTFGCGRSSSAAGYL